MTGDLGHIDPQGHRGIEYPSTIEMQGQAILFNEARSLSHVVETKHLAVVGIL